MALTIFFKVIVVLALLNALALVSGSNIIVYDDKLENSFQDWSWGTHSLTNPSPVHSGNDSISYTPGASSAYDAIYFYQAAYINPSIHSGISFWVNGGTSGSQSLQISLVIYNSSTKNSALTGPLSQVGSILSGFSSIPANQWAQAYFPISSAPVQAYDGFLIQSNAAGSQPVLYLDDVQIVPVGGSAPSSSSSSSTSSSTVTGVSVSTSTSSSSSGGSSGGACALTGLKVSGNSLINGNGQKVKLVGVNRSGMEFSCVQDGAFSDGPVDATSIAAMKTWNINTVRVPVNEDCFLGINGANPEGSSYQTQLVAYFNLLTQNGFAIILDLHWTADGATLATAQTPMPDASHAVTFWTQAATLFGSYSNVIFDLFNEPYPCFSGSGMSCSTTNCDGSSTTQAWECLLNGGSSCPGLSYTAAGFQSLVTAIRATGATNVIMSNGIHYSGCLDQWSTYKPTDPLNNIIPGAHIYAGHTCSDSGCWGSYIQPLTSKYPVLFGEFGEYDCATTFINQLMTWADPLNINYVAWTWNTWDCASGPALISDYTGTATAYGAGFQSHIASLPAYCSAPSSSTATSSSTSTHATTASTSTSTSTSTHATTASTATSTSTSTHSTSTSTSASSTGTSGCHATVSATLSSSWNGGGQVAITVTNSGTSPIKSVSLAISGSPSVFNLVVITAGNYNLASYAFPLAVSSSFTGGGFTYSGSEPSVTLSSVGC